MKVPNSFRSTRELIAAVLRRCDKDRFYETIFYLQYHDFEGAEMAPAFHAWQALETIEVGSERFDETPAMIACACEEYGCDFAEAHDVCADMLEKPKPGLIVNKYE